MGPDNTFAALLQSGMIPGMNNDPGGNVASPVASPAPTPPVTMADVPVPGDGSASAAAQAATQPAPFQSDIDKMEQQLAAMAKQRQLESNPMMDSMLSMAQKAVEHNAATRNVRMQTEQSLADKLRIDAEKRNADLANKGDFTYLMGKMFNMTPDALDPRKRSKGQYASDILSNIGRAIASNGEFTPIQEERRKAALETYQAGTTRMQAISNATRADLAQSQLEETKRKLDYQTMNNMLIRGEMDERSNLKDPMDLLGSQQKWALARTKHELDTMVAEHRITQDEANLRAKYAVMQKDRDIAQSKLNFEQQFRLSGANSARMQGVADPANPKTPEEAAIVEKTMTDAYTKYGQLYRQMHPERPYAPQNHIIGIPSLEMTPDGRMQSVTKYVNAQSDRNTGTTSVNDLFTVPLVSKEEQAKSAAAVNMDNEFSRTSSAIVGGMLNGSLAKTTGLWQGSEGANKLRAAGLLPASLDDNATQALLGTQLGREVGAAAKALASGRVNNYDIQFVQKYTGNSQMNGENLLLRSMVNKYFPGTAAMQQYMRLPGFQSKAALDVMKNYVESYVSDVSKHKGQTNYKPEEMISTIGMLRKAYAAEGKVLTQDPTTKQWKVE